MKYSCRNCGNEIEDIAEGMLNGCECGSRVFKQKKNTSQNSNKEELDMPHKPNSIQTKATNNQVRDDKKDAKEIDGKSIEEIIDMEDDNVAIFVKGSGQYNVNLKTLLDRNSELDPLMVKDKNGVVKVLFNPDA